MRLKKNLRMHVVKLSRVCLMFDQGKGILVTVRRYGGMWRFLLMKSGLIVSIIQLCLSLQTRLFVALVDLGLFWSRLNLFNLFITLI